jgi:hypothetical protein
MKAEVFEREIYYDFTSSEVDFLRSLDLWEELKNRLKPHERVLVEGYVRNE